MYIDKITVHNFRLLQNSTLDFHDPLCLLLGRNNSGKTSFLVVVEKFLKGGTFDINDFSLGIRKELLSIEKEKSFFNILGIYKIGSKTNIINTLEKLI